MSGFDVTGKLYDVFVRYPVSYLTGKDAKDVEPSDAIPVYAGAALWPLAIFGIAGCDGNMGGGDAGDEYDTEGWDTGGESECMDADVQYSYSGPPETLNTGICHEQIEICIDGFWQVTQEEVLPQEEIDLNDLDDDCDGMVDECADGETKTSYSGPEGTLNVGVCRELIEVCNSGIWEVTQEEILPETEILVNELDDDCDDYVDEIDLNGEEMSQGIDGCLLNPPFVRIQNGAMLTFNCADVVLETDLLEVDSASALDISAKSCGGADGLNGSGSADGGGGGGGSHIGSGGLGEDGGWTGLGGEVAAVYGSAGDFVAETGSCGGDGGGPFGAMGGYGGGAITLIVGTADMMGSIFARGGDGGVAPYDDGGGGGGSGGSILINADILNVGLSSTRLFVTGGSGGSGGAEYAGGGGGGGGGGGSIEIVFDEANIMSVATYYPESLEDFNSMMFEFGCYQVIGGSGAGNGQPGSPGAVNTTMP